MYCNPTVWEIATTSLPVALPAVTAFAAASFALCTQWTFHDHRIVAAS